MARIYARRKGKSGSKRPITRKTHPDWSSLNPREVESRILDLAREGKSTSEIGLILRDQYAVPDVKLATGKNILKILKANNLKSDIPEDLRNLIKTSLQIRKHLTVNKKDIKNNKNLQLTDSKIRRLIKYYKAKSKLPKDWKFSADKAKLMFE